MIVHWHVEILASGPDRVVIRSAERRSPESGGTPGTILPTEEIVFSRRWRISRRCLVGMLLQEDLGQAGTPARSICTEVGQPTIVRPKA